jgi:hypothetical protein
MQSVGYFAAVAALTILPQLARAADQVVRECDFAVKARCASGDARVTLAGTTVTRVEVDVVWCGRPNAPGFTCTIDSSRGDGESKWSDEGGATLIANPSPLDPDQRDRIKVTVGRSVSIDLEQTQSPWRCGAGAELPRAIVIPPQGKTCRVWMSEP